MIFFTQYNTKSIKIPQYFDAGSRKKGKSQLYYITKMWLNDLKSINGKRMHGKSIYLRPVPAESRPRDKRLRYMAVAERAVASFQQWLNETAL